MCLTKNKFPTCKNGHEFTSENTYVAPNGYRACILCHKENRKRWYRRTKLKKLAA